ncbi:proline-rich protein HaeIII subfamily 1-like [Penaeus vannamei]|uniref:proline-rich protein HaeIII subfamily 1-like n=1 Tax=Penaeus vannamei TaxID=6689 RepID=UPI00387F438F
MTRRGAHAVGTHGRCRCRPRAKASPRNATRKSPRRGTPYPTRPGRRPRRGRVAPPSPWCPLAPPRARAPAPPPCSLRAPPCRRPRALQVDPQPPGPPGNPSLDSPQSPTSPSSPP